MLQWRGRGSHPLTFDLGEERQVETIEIACEYTILQTDICNNISTLSINVIRGKYSNFEKCRIFINLATNNI